MNAFADEASAAFGEAMVTLTSVERRFGGLRRLDGAIAIFTASAVASHNFVMILNDAVSSSAVTELVGYLADAKLPFSVQLRPNLRPGIRELLADFKLTCTSYTPLMVLSDMTDITVGKINGFNVHAIKPGQASIHAAIAGGSFGVESGIFSQRITDEVLEVPGVRCYVGTINGIDAATALGVISGSFVEIFNVATLPEYRHKGYGTELTKAAIVGGRDLGASSAVLMASPMGRQLYQELGFHTLEEWEIWERVS